MRFFRLDLLTLLISLFILNSCKNPDGVGLDVGENQVSGTLTVDTNVTLHTVKEDSVVVSDLSRSPLGFFNDPAIGTTEASMITNINLPNQTSYTIPTGTITIDSVILGLKYAMNGFYGDSLNSTYKINVYQLNDKPVPTQAYYNSKKWTHKEDLLGTKTFKVRLYDTLKISAIVKGKPDTLTRVLPQVRVPLDQAFIRKNLLTVGDQIGSNIAFQNYARGLYITLDKSVTTGTGGIMAFGRTDANLSSTADSIYVYARINNSGTIDTSIIALPITRRIAEVSQTYNDDVKAAIANTTTSNQTVYLQGMGGLKAKLSFDGLKNLPKNIIINRAELVLVPKAGTAVPFAPLRRLVMYKLDLAGQRTPIEDMISPVSGYASFFGGYYNNPVKGEYRFLLTSYIQNLLSGKTQDYGTYLAPASELNTSGTDISATFAPIGRTLLTGKNSPYRVQLKIIYTNIK